MAILHAVPVNRRRPAKQSILQCFHMDDFSPRELFGARQPAATTMNDCREIAPPAAKVPTILIILYRSGKYTVRPQKLNIEGVQPASGSCYHLSAIDPRTQDKRLRKRSGPLLYKRFIEEWLPLENSYFREFRIMEQCHLVFLQN